MTAGEQEESILNEEYLTENILTFLVKILCSAGIVPAF
jgi:hypothetical protein